jgi:hypothetical protein
MDEITTLIDILEESLERNWDKPITIKHLLNIIKMQQRNLEWDPTWIWNYDWWDFYKN